MQVSLLVVLQFIQQHFDYNFIIIKAKTRSRSGFYYVDEGSRTPVRRYRQHKLLRVHPIVISEVGADSQYFTVL